MKALGQSALFARVNAAEYAICRRLNRGTALVPICLAFKIASRLGDGPVWYALLALLPLIYGPTGIRPALAMGATGLAGVLLYQWLKRTFVRERPFITHAGIARGAAPLDRYSFPSGHTLHAVSFTWQASTSFPDLAWALVPLAAMIAASRVVLGLHYPTDVAAGAAIGAGLAQLGLAMIGS